MESMGKRIKFIREYRGFTQKALAEKIGVSLISIKGYEADKSVPRPEQMEKLCSVLKIKEEFLHGKTIDSKDSINALIYDIISSYGCIDFVENNGIISITIDPRQETDCHNILKAAKQAYENLMELGMSTDDYKHWLLNQ